MVSKMGQGSKLEASVLEALNSGKKVVLPRKSPAGCRLRALCALWNFALDEDFPDAERVDIATEMIRTLPS